MKYFFVLLGCFASCATATAQEVWSVDRCMAYAVENNNTVKQRELDVKNYRKDAKYTLRMEVSGYRGTDSYGNVIFSLSPYVPFQSVESDKTGRK